MAAFDSSRSRCLEAIEVAYSQSCGRLAGVAFPASGLRLNRRVERKPVSMSSQRKAFAGKRGSDVREGERMKTATRTKCALVASRRCARISLQFPRAERDVENHRGAGRWEDRRSCADEVTEK
jgi:hypothetical protein